MKCECSERGFCPRRNAYVPRPQWRQCQAGKGDQVDRVVEALATQPTYKTYSDGWKEPLPVYGPQYNHWVSLHMYAVLEADNWDTRKAVRWFATWEKKIRGNTCRCKANWAKLNLVPDYSSAKAFFEWAWYAHDLVTRRILADGGKGQLITLDECYAIWWHQDSNMGGSNKCQ